MTNQSAKERTREILERLYWAGFHAHKASLDPRNSKGIRAIEEKSQEEALDSIEEIVKEIIGQENEHYKDMPVPDPDPFALPSDHQNQLRRYQLKRWDDK